MVGCAEALAGQLDAMRIVHEAVQNGVGVGGIANDLVPRRERELGGDDRRPTAVSLEDFEQVMTGAGVEGLEAEIVENEKIGSAEDLMRRGWRRPASARSSQSFGQR